MNKVFVCSVTMWGYEDRVLWEEELPHKFDSTTVKSALKLKVGERCGTNDPFLKLERVE